MNRPLTKMLVAMTLALGGLAAPAFAGQTIAISYHQVGICKGYDTAAGPVTTRSDEAFAIFKIEAVDNTKPSGSFDFDPTHLYVDQSNPEQKAKTAVWDKNRRFVYSDPRFAQNMGVSSAVETNKDDEEVTLAGALRSSAMCRSAFMRALSGDAGCLW